ncbi:hypothetical protein H257_08340 [Aphanomyces astaci]|uniref:Uncharacterized protein n=1 Tax=Aphanomyces astaci TaxID=112090 RepID=W4GFV2_APHAT|nr:hypothetical protein H257_08340 [Aphanomyces astaci]ETV78136.1 hypothetical protein H257_08340 [Aphanomyces astaci]|eukprot:XP_009832473.1 hypothetical protein H257_08340 [Aphanomyces astaci]
MFVRFMEHATTRKTKYADMLHKTTQELMIVGLIYLLVKLCVFTEKFMTLVRLQFDTKGTTLTLLQADKPMPSAALRTPTQINDWRTNRRVW